MSELQTHKHTNTQTHIQNEEDMSKDNADEAAWFSTGYDEMDSMPDEGSRFRLKQGEERTLLFIDGGPNDQKKFNTKVDAPFCINEFEFSTERPDGELEYYNWMTSTKGRLDSSGAPFPDYPRQIIPAMKPYYAGFYTVLDITDAYDKDGRGEVFKNILCAKKKLLKILRRHARKHGGLRGCVYAIHRSSKKVARTGDDWQFEEKLDEAEIQRYVKMGNLKDEPFDYLRLLAPKSEAECKLILANYVPPKPFGQTDDDRRGGRRSRGRDRDDDYDDEPRSRRRRRDEDEDDDRRRSRRRSRDDDRDEPRGRSRRGRSQDQEEDIAEADLPFEEGSSNSRRSRSRDDADEPESVASGVAHQDDDVEY